MTRRSHPSEATRHIVRSGPAAPSPVSPEPFPSAPETVEPRSSRAIPTSSSSSSFPLSAGPPEPVVVLESGLAAPVEVWAALTRQLSPHVAVVASERPGVCRSADTGGPVDLDALGRGLGDVVRLASPHHPVVLVAEGFGGLIAQRYARRFPDRVGGLVLVDSPHPATLALSSRQRQGMARLESVLLRSAVRARLGRGLGGHGFEAMDAADAASARAALAAAPHTIRTALRELRAWKRAAPASLVLQPLPHDPPVAVMASERLLVGDPSHARLQADLLTLSARARLHRVADPDPLQGADGVRQVADVVREMVAELRATAAERTSRADADTAAEAAERQAAADLPRTGADRPRSTADLRDASQLDGVAS